MVSNTQKTSRVSCGIFWEQHNTPENEEKDEGMEEESHGGGASADIRHGKDPSEDPLRHAKSLRIGDEEKDECRIKSILCLECHIQIAHRRFFCVFLCFFDEVSTRFLLFVFRPPPWTLGYATLRKLSAVIVSPMPRKHPSQ